MKGLFITGSPVETPGSPGRAGSRSEPEGQVLQDSQPPRTRSRRPGSRQTGAAVHYQPTAGVRGEGRAGGRPGGRAGGRTALTDPQLAPQPGSPGGREVWREGDKRVWPEETVAFV